MLTALVNVPASIGYPLLFVLVGAESAGALVPGEASLILAGALAAQGQLALPPVIAIAAAAAIVGDNIGYLIGRRGLRPLLDRPGRLSGRRQRLVARGEAFFQRYGAAAVFFGRWLPGLRVVASWLAGAEQMPWRALSALERPRRDRLGIHDRHSRVSDRPKRLRRAGSDRLRRPSARGRRLPHPPDPRAHAATRPRRTAVPSTR